MCLSLRCPCGSISGTLGAGEAQRGPLGLNRAIAVRAQGLPSRHPCFVLGFGLHNE